MYIPFTHHEATQLHTKSLWLEINPKIKPILDTPTKAELHITNTLMHIKQESVHVLYLTPRNHLIKTQRIYQGPFSSARLDKDHPLKNCIDNNAARIIMLHHNPTSPIQITERHRSVLNYTQQSLKLVGMRVDDFFVTGRDLCNSSTSNNGRANPNLAERPIHIVSMAREGLVPEIDVTSDSKLGQGILANYRRC